MKCEQFGCKLEAAKYGIGAQNSTETFQTLALCNQHKFWYQLKGYQVTKEKS